MIGKTTQPKNKSELLRSIQAIRSMDFEVIEAGSKQVKAELNRTLDRFIQKAPISIILIKGKIRYENLQSFQTDACRNEKEPQADE
jgi:hypothetical protein